MLLGFVGMSCYHFLSVLLRTILQKTKKGMNCNKHGIKKHKLIFYLFTLFVIILVE